MTGDGTQGRGGEGILAIWHGVAPGYEAEMLAWYDREHHFERLATPGFLGVRRYEAARGGPPIFVRYETRDPGVLSSPAYLARLNDPTPWTLRSQPQVRDYSRTVCARRWRVGGAEGGFVAVLRFAGEAPAALDDPRSVEALIGAPGAFASGVLGAEFWRADEARSAIASRERELRGARERHVEAVLVLHATGLEAAADAARRALAGVADPAGADVAVYRLVFFADGAARTGAATMDYSAVK